MQKYLIAIVLGGLVFAMTFAPAQPPGGRGQPPGGGGPGGAARGGDPVAAAVTRMFDEFDANKDGKLTKEEVTDERLHDLFERSKTKDGVVTKESLTGLLTKEQAASQQSGGGRGGRGGPGGPGGGPPGGPGGGGRGGPDGGRGVAQPGLILSPVQQDDLKLTDDQKKKIVELQKNVDTQLDKILTDDQKKQLKEMATTGPGGGRGGPGGAGGGRGGPGGGGRGRDD